MSPRCETRHDMLAALLSDPDLYAECTDREREFLDSIAQQVVRSCAMTARQGRWLAAIYERRISEQETCRLLADAPDARRHRQPADSKYSPQAMRGGHCGAS